MPEGYLNEADRSIWQCRARCSVCLLSFGMAHSSVKNEGQRRSAARIMICFDQIRLRVITSSRAIISACAPGRVRLTCGSRPSAMS